MQISFSGGKKCWKLVRNIKNLFAVHVGAQLLKELRYHPRKHGERLKMGKAIVLLGVLFVWLVLVLGFFVWLVGLVWFLFWVFF